MKKNMIIKVALFLFLFSLLAFLINKSIDYSTLANSMIMSDVNYMSSSSLSYAIGYTLLSCLVLLYIIFLIVIKIKNLNFSKITSIFLLSLISIYFVTKFFNSFFNLIFVDYTILNLLSTLFYSLFIITFIIFLYAYFNHKLNKTVTKNIFTGIFSLLIIAILAHHIFANLDSYSYYKNYYETFTAPTQEIIDTFKVFFYSSTNISLFTSICYSSVLLLSIVLLVFIFLKIDKKINIFNKVILILVMLIIDIYIFINMATCIFYVFTLSDFIINLLLILTTTFFFISLLFFQNSSSSQETQSSDC